MAFYTQGEAPTQFKNVGAPGGNGSRVQLYPANTPLPAEPCGPEDSQYIQWLNVTLGAASLNNQFTNLQKAVTKIILANFDLTQSIWVIVSFATIAALPFPGPPTGLEQGFMLSNLTGFDNSKVLTMCNPIRNFYLSATASAATRFSLAFTSDVSKYGPQG